LGRGFIRRTSGKNSKSFNEKARRRKDSPRKAKKSKAFLCVSQIADKPSTVRPERSRRVERRSVDNPKNQQNQPSTAVHPFDKLRANGNKLLRFYPVWGFVNNLFSSRLCAFALKKTRQNYANMTSSAPTSA
jgi:hypothetical protein